MFNDEQITYQQAKETKDPNVMVKYCIQGASENNQIHDEPFSVWENGKHIAETYLDFLDYGDEIPEGVVDALDTWLEEQKAEEQIK